MNADEPLPPDDQFAVMLAAWDEALAAGVSPQPPAGGSGPPELEGRLGRGLACLQRLRGWRSRRPSLPHPVDTPRPHAPGPAATDRNLLFGVLALQADLIDQARFVEACTLWTTRKHIPLADLLVERGWLTGDDRDHVEWLLGRQIHKHRGDAHASLAAVTDGPVRHALSALGDADVHRSLAGLTPSADAASGGTIHYAPEPDQRYTRTRLHATGGIGRVWLAYDSDLGREVALKELRPERSQNRHFADRFLHEAQITGQLEHPGIVPVYELTRPSEDRQPFYTMRFIKGRTLTDAIRAYHQKRAAGRGEPLEQVALLNAFVATCNAVAYAHSRGVIHRDLKGQNVVLGDFGEVVVLDWGFAKVLGRAEGSTEAAPVALAQGADLCHTVQGQVIGTPAYMAPEQAEGRTDRIDRRTDVYGLGAILYELLTGRPPFAGTEVEEVLRQVREEEPARPRQVCAGVPRALDAVCLRALAKEPAKRYASVGELAREVQRWLADEPVTAYREPAAARLGRWARRHQTLAAGLAALLLATVVSIVLLREERVRNAEQLQAAEERTVLEANAKKREQTITYLKHVALANREVLAKQLDRADDLLGECTADLRDWEWHYLLRRTNLNLHALRGHTGGLWCVVYSPDGQQLASAGDDGTIRIWNARTGQPIGKLPGHAGGIFRLAYRPPDGLHLASTGINDGKVRVWDTTTFKEVFVCPHQHSRVVGVDYSPDGRLLASSSWDQTMRIWDATNGQEIRTLVRHISAGFGVLAFRPPDGRQLAAVAYDNTLSLWDVANGQPIRTFTGGVNFGNVRIAFSPNGRLLAAGQGDNRTVRVWDATNGQEIWALRGHTDSVPAVAFSPDNGRLLASASWDQSVRVWDTATGQLLRTLRGHPARLTAVAFSPDGRQLASAGEGGIVKIWDVTDLEKKVGPECHSLGSHPNGVRGLAFSPDNRSLVTAGQDGTVKTWSTATGPEIRTFKSHQGPAARAVFSPDGKRLASAGEDGRVVVRDARTGQDIYTLCVPAAPVRSVVFSTDGQRLVTANGDRAVTVWNAVSGQEVRTLHGHGDVIHGVALSPDGRWLAAADAAGTLQLWEANTGQEILTLHHDQPINPTELALKGVRPGQDIRARTRSASCVAFSSDGKRLAWTGEDTTITIWDLSSLPPSLPQVPAAALPIVTLRGHTDWVTSLAFSPNGKRLATAGEDGIVKLWDTKTGQEALTPRGHTGVIRGLAFSPDARLLAAAGDDGTITIWDGTPLD